MGQKTDNDNVLTSAVYDGVCVAIATPPGQSAIAVIRLSGEGSAQLIDPLFEPLSGRFKKAAALDGYSCSVGYIKAPGSQTVIDQVVLTRFEKPNSYTGEEMIEISCHGGTAVKRALLDLIIAQGARAAEAGEFSKRAFLNGKMDLIQAEAVIDLIEAQTSKGVYNATAQLRGQTSRQVEELNQRLLQVQAALELVLEFPEHEETQEVQSELAEQLETVRREVKAQVDSYRQGRILNEGMNVVLAGRPNAGKSSLFNALAGVDRAIVTDIAGTTRDTIEIRLTVDGILVNLVDTAGVRESADLIEGLGVARTRSAWQTADLVFWLIARPFTDIKEDVELMKQIPADLLVPLISKDDLEDDGQLASIREYLPLGPVIQCSVLTGEGLPEIRRKIVQRYAQLGAEKMSGVLVTNSRQKNCLDRVLSYIEEASNALATGITWDVVASLVRAGLTALAELTGDTVSETLIDTIFSRFCVGK